MVDPAGDIAVLAVPYAGATAVVREYGDALQGKVIIDITNPVSLDFQGFVTPDGSSGAQEIAEAAPAGAHVVQAFNTLFSHVLAAGPAEGRLLDAFIAGDDTQAKRRVSAFHREPGTAADGHREAGYGADTGERRPVAAGPFAHSVNTPTSSSASAFSAERTRTTTSRATSRTSRATSRQWICGTGRSSPSTYSHQEQSHARFRHWRDRPFRFVHHPRAHRRRT
ncbi:NADPH-dependent F420 reductase [Streptomyces mirabilis]|uniref:NADPH-dependent F420 reductase n=1 Tax=Streptomyces mirabilis TaxID=68239 RepID=UPI00368473A4